MIALVLAWLLGAAPSPLPWTPARPASTPSPSALGSLATIGST